MSESWTWDGWNYGGDAFYGQDDLQGTLYSGPIKDGRPVMFATSTDGEDIRIEVTKPEYAHLIAAAPALLAACKAVLEYENYDDDYPEELLKAAIAKAKGVPPDA